MAPKIEKIWNSVFGNTSIVRRKVSEENQKQDTNKHPQKDKEQKGSEPQQPITYSKEVLEKAVSEFSVPEIKVELLETKNGFKIKMSQSSGTLIRILSPAEFMDLKESSNVDKASRGKILDQRF